MAQLKLILIILFHLRGGIFGPPFTFKIKYASSNCSISFNKRHTCSTVDREYLRLDMLNRENLKHVALGGGLPLPHFMSQQTFFYSKIKEMRSEIVVVGILRTPTPQTTTLPLPHTKTQRLGFSRFGEVNALFLAKQDFSDESAPSLYQKRSYVPDT